MWLRSPSVHIVELSLFIQPIRQSTECSFTWQDFAPPTRKVFSDDAADGQVRGTTMTDTNESLPWYRRGPHEDALPRRAVPEPHYLVGSEQVPLRVFLRRGAWDVIEAFAAGPGADERGGILVGRPYEDDAGPFVIIEGAVPAYAAHPTSGGLTFTQQAWDDMEATVRERFPSDNVVGWFHTHADSGVSLSGYDRFTAHRFFPEWWQLTYVIDPIRQRQGVYFWHDGDLRPLPGFWVCEAEADADAIVGGEVASAAVAVAVSEAVAAGTSDRRRSPTAALVAVCVLLLLLALLPWPGSLSSLNRELRRQEAETRLLMDELGQLRDRHQVLQQVATELEQDDGGVTVGQPRGDADVEPVDAVVEASDAGGDDAAPVPDPPRTRPEIIAAGPEALPQPGYIVRSGDTLWSISERLLGDPYAYMRVARQNDLDDPNLILPGWELELPSTQGDAAAGSD